MTESLLMSYKVMYVEDDEDTRNAMQYFLKKRVGKLIVAKNGSEGLEKYKKYGPDMVITDLRMPEIDGLEMTRYIRQMGRPCTVIVITAFSDVETVIEAVDLGIDKYIQKPLNTKELIQAMSEVAKKALVEKDGTEHIGNLRFGSLEAKKAMEEKVQKQVALFIKKHSGKGPQVVRAFFKGNFIEIEAIGGVTIMEKALMSNPKNNHLVNFARETLYLDRNRMIEDVVGDIIGQCCVLEKVEINLKRERDLLILSVKSGGLYL